jgi:hypothetical protein
MAVWLILLGCGRAAEKTILQDYLDESLIVDTRTRIYLMHLDVTGDSEPEVFLAASDAGGAFGLTWGVYSPLGNGTYRRHGFITFHYDAFYFSEAESLLSVYVRLSAELGGYTHYRVTTDGFEELTDEVDGAVETLRAAEWQASGRPKLYWTLLSSLRSPEPVLWKEYHLNETGPDLGRLDGLIATESP